MSLHKLATVTITIEGLPEYTGTDDKLQELTYEVKEFIHFLVSDPVIDKVLTKEFPELKNKVEIWVKGPQ